MRSVEETAELKDAPWRSKSNPGYFRSTAPAKIEAKGWVMQLLADSPNDELRRATPVSSRTM